MIINPKKHSLEGYATIKDVEEVEEIANNAQNDANTARNAANEAKATSENKAPMYSYGTEDLVAGTTSLEFGKLHFVYE